VLIDDVQVEDYDAFAIPGGFREFGFKDEAFNERTLELIRDFDSHDKPIATVCVAAFALAEISVTKLKRAFM